MKHHRITFLSLTFVLLIFSQQILAEIKSPNYDFSLTSLEQFFPGKTLGDFTKDKMIKSDMYEDLGDIKIMKFKINRGNYLLDIYTQVKGNQIIDMYVRMPQHFSHDLFLAELQKRYKKQDKYFQKDMNALYTWNDRDGNNIIYHGSCSITCFPMSIEVVSNDKKVIPLTTKFNEALPKK